MSSQVSNPRITQVVANNSVKPVSVISPDSIRNVAPTAAAQTVSPSLGQSVTQSQQVFPPAASSQTANITNTGSPYTQQLNNFGININPQQNPLNEFANYTYHVRFSMMSVSSTYNQNGTYATMNSTNKFVIAESGVTAGFNISEFEYVNLCAPGPKQMNTTSTTWTMTIVEPYGMSFIDKMFTAGKELNIDNWSRIPYFIEVWFNGYNVDGSIMSPTQFYTLYRVILLDINVKVTEGGSVYSLSGVFDGDIGHANDISIPDATFNMVGKTVLDFFTEFSQALNTSKPNNINDTNAPVTQYIFNIPNEIAKWNLMPKQVEEVSARTSSFNVRVADGTTIVQTPKGASMENIINAVIGTCDQASTWISATSNDGSQPSQQLSTSGISTWILLHAYVQLGTFNKTTNDYNRTVIFNLIPYKSVIGVTDRASVNALSNSGVQRAKLNFLIQSNALVKEYDYLYTGLNTEVIRFDISIDNAWQIAIPQWSALNSYYNITVPPVIRENTPAYNWATGKFDLPSNSPNTTPNNPTNVDGTGFTQYIEDLPARDANTGFPFSIVVRQTNKPNAQLADNSTGTGRAVGSATSNGINAPFSRALVSTYLENLFGANSSFMNIELEIRGDPYWMGNGNVVDDSTASSSYVNGTHTPIVDNTVSIPVYPVTTPTGTRASYLQSSVMFILSFRTGENYNESTGIMTFEASSQFYNGAYAVTQVTNSFKQGSFTQTLTAYKDPLAQIATAAISIAPPGQGGIGHQ